jgi:hypothetical protein
VPRYREGKEPASEYGYCRLAAWFSSSTSLARRSESTVKDLLARGNKDAQRHRRDAPRLPTVLYRAQLEARSPHQTHTSPTLVAPQIANRNRMFDGTSKEARPDA